MVERRPPQAPPASGHTGQREDTVAIPVNRPAPSNGAASGNGRVLPPMPKEAPDAPAGRSATPPPPPTSRPTTQPTAPTPAAAPRQRPAVSPMPVPQVDKRAERQAERDAKAAERAAAKQAAREQKEATTPAKPQVAETKDVPKASRRARLRMTRIDPWSVMKTAFLLSIALGIVVVVSVFMVWSVLDAADVWSSINQTVRDVLGGESATTFDIEDYLGTRRVVGFAMIVAAVDVVLLTAIATLGAFLYNMSASLLGGIEVTLAEDK
jgi:hypothetical protein